LKKTFKLQESGKHPDRTMETIKHQLRKYLKREKKKKIQSTNSFWDFECRFGESEDNSKEVTFNDIIKLLDVARAEEWKECYVEILAVAKEKSLKEKTVEIE
jgi:hypothetical protein